MYKDKRVLGVITARGKSRTVPGKNVRPLAGKPLIAYTIEAAKGSAHLTRCIVSTDCESIAETARALGADVPFLRPLHLAQATSTSIEVVQHALQWLKENKNEEYDYVLILQPTSPLRNVSDIDRSIEKIADTGADSVMGMVEIQDFAIEKLKWIDGDRIKPLFVEEGKISRRRDETANAYKRNAAIYLTRVDCIESSDLFGKDSRAHIMPFERSLDVNDPIDFELAEFWLYRQGNHAA